MKLKITIDNKTTKWMLRSQNLNAGAPPRLHQTVDSSAVRTPAAVAVGAAPWTAARCEDKVCRSPVSGIVASVVAQPGQTLQVGDVCWCWKP